ncbi:MAG: acyl-CoA thioesterase [Mastigocoleus sp.]
MVENGKLFRPLEVEIVIPVRTYDIDFAGIVSNIVYIRWLEDLRLKILDEYLPLTKELNKGIAPAIYKTEIEYKRPIQLFESVIGQMWMSNLSRVKYTLQAEIIVNNHIAATATQTGVFLSMNNHRPVKVPEELSRQYSEYKFNFPKT